MSGPILLTIDIPALGSSISGTLTFAGWTLSRAGAIVKVTYAIAVWGLATYGISREDVAAANPEAIGVPNVGWEVPGFNSANLANGTHTLTIEATDSAGNVFSVARAFTVSNDPSASTSEPVGSPAPVTSAHAGPYVISLAVANGDLIATFSNGSTQTLALPLGAQGPPGPAGQPGTQGPQGPPGEAPPSTTFTSIEDYDGPAPKGIGVIDGTNMNFELSFAPVDVIPLVFWGGVKRKRGADYALNGQSLQTDQPIPASMAGTLMVWYWHE
jgi:hypothetical protein